MQPIAKLRKDEIKHSKMFCGERGGGPRELAPLFLVFCNFYIQRHMELQSLYQINPIQKFLLNAAGGVWLLFQKATVPLLLEFVFGYISVMRKESQEGFDKGAHICYNNIICNYRYLPGRRDAVGLESADEKTG